MPLDETDAFKTRWLASLDEDDVVAVTVHGRESLSSAYSARRFIELNPHLTVAVRPVSDPERADYRATLDANIAYCRTYGAD